MTKVLITDPIDQTGIDILSQVAQVDQRIGISNSELASIIKDYDALMIRSGTQVTEEIINSSNKLRIIGRAGVGVDNVDVKAATQKGVLVVNSPGGNTIAAAEHTIAMMLTLSRHIPIANMSTFLGKWERKKFVGNELYKKKLGVVGLGKIGAHVAKVANALGMEVYGYDPFVSTERAQQIQVKLSELEDLFQQSDYVTLHLPRTPETENLVNMEVLKSMKSSAKLINCARGGLIDEEALAEALNKSLIAGAAIDVFSKEPLESNSPLLKVEKNLILTPHLGASTEEAQENVAIQVAEQMSNYLSNGAITNALNIPSISAEDAPKLKPYIKLCEQIGKLAGQITETSIKNIKIEFGGQVALLNTKPLISVLVAGLLSHSMEAVNVVNAPVIAKNRNMNITSSIREKTGDYITDISLTVETERRTRNVVGTLYGNQPRIVEVMNTRIEAELGPNMLFITNEDKPGFIGSLGSILADAKINIATFHLGRTKVGGDAIALIEIDEAVSKELIETLNLSLIHI